MRRSASRNLRSQSDHDNAPGALEKLTRPSLYHRQNYYLSRDSHMVRYEKPTGRVSLYDSGRLD